MSAAKNVSSQSGNGSTFLSAQSRLSGHVTKTVLNSYTGWNRRQPGPFPDIGSLPHCGGEINYATHVVEASASSVYGEDWKAQSAFMGTWVIFDQACMVGRIFFLSNFDALVFSLPPSPPPWPPPPPPPCHCRSP